MIRARRYGNVDEAARNACRFAVSLLATGKATDAHHRQRSSVEHDRLFQRQRVGPGDRRVEGGHVELGSSKLQGEGVNRRGAEPVGLGDPERDAGKGGGDRTVAKLYLESCYPTSGTRRQTFALFPCFGRAHDCRLHCLGLPLWYAECGGAPRLPPLWSAKR